MKIKSLMIPNPITIGPRATIAEAIELMKINSFRHLPVVSETNDLIGFITLADLKQGLIPAMLADVALTDLMIKHPITVRPQDDIEIAAQLIYKHKIGGMPVVSNNRLVGIITESDILRAFIDMMGLLSASSRIDVTMHSDPAVFNQAIQLLQTHGADIINVGMANRHANQRTYYFRLSACDTRPLKTAMEAAGFSVVDAMN
jgi:acetoin utilization protein AcuB